ncbi:MAG: beta-lactamase family protein [Taibaiella sp.]|nr:beta-lactamase family protein [Taibaiella sp.]
MKHQFKLSLLALALFFAACTSAPVKKGTTTAVKQTDDYSANIDSLIKATDPRSFNGVVLIQQNGKVMYTKAHGFSDFNKKTALEIGDQFSTMSIAKQITATLVLQEVDKGTIDLQVPIRKYLPGFKYPWADTINLHQLLNHTSGLQSDNPDLPLKFRPGKAFSYSNVGYAVAGLILEQQSGKSFETLVTDLFNKCGMEHSAYPSADNSKLLSKGHTIKTDGTVARHEQLSFDATHCFGSHLIVTAPDLARWNENLHGGKLLKPATYKLMTSYEMTNAHPLFGNEPIGYGYGLRINDKDSIKEIGHTGFHPAEGFTAVNLYYPGSKTSVIVLENVAHENFEIAYYFEQEARKIVKASKLLR